MLNSVALIVSYNDHAYVIPTINNESTAQMTVCLDHRLRRNESTVRKNVLLIAWSIPIFTISANGALDPAAGEPPALRLHHSAFHQVIEYGFR